ncbi:hypothetical protein CQW23_17294 [Capsicum baccatum]|uniref:Fungal lipase-like domain-containing protein n=1 Tax=Capsicum baccatum TaxID=33114 RepID=A0A2G2WDL8_CAPBA|nr:hypothetical protein CQW23_17294 [Capsicum baccatum]
MTNLGQDLCSGGKRRQLWREARVLILGAKMCIIGHSLGDGFALEVYKALAAKRTHVEAHFFNPPSISLAMSLRILSGKAGFVWKIFKSILPSNSEYQSRSVVEGAAEATE